MGGCAVSPAGHSPLFRVGVLSSPPQLVRSCLSWRQERDPAPFSAGAYCGGSPPQGRQEGGAVGSTRTLEQVRVIIESGGVDIPANQVDEVHELARRAAGQHSEVVVHLAPAEGSQSADVLRARLIARGARGPEHVATGHGARPVTAVRNASRVLERRTRRDRERRREHRRAGAATIRA